MARGEEILDPSFPFSPETPDTQAKGGGSAEGATIISVITNISFSSFSKRSPS